MIELSFPPFLPTSFPSSLSFLPGQTEIFQKPVPADILKHYKEYIFFPMYLDKIKEVRQQTPALCALSPPSSSFSSFPPLELNAVSSCAESGGSQVPDHEAVPARHRVDTAQLYHLQWW